MHFKMELHGLIRLGISDDNDSFFIHLHVHLDDIIRAFQIGLLDTANCITSFISLPPITSKINAEY